MPNKISPEQEVAMAAFSKMARVSKGTPVSEQGTAALMNSAYKNPKALPPTRAAAKAELSKRTGKTVAELDALWAEAQRAQTT